ncbi:MAG: PadR family transcriptional regulator [Clostridia bacterium]|nr:PadR family transcriptional regulator [Clostridia bacterium]
MGKERKIDMVILGLLSHERLSGYDIKKRIDGTISFFWKGSFGSIYPSLSAMEEEGLITSTNESINGRDKITYEITKAGKNKLKEWLKDTKATNDLKYETLLKVFFGGVGGKEITLNSIDSFETDIKRDLEILRCYQSNLSKALDNEDHMYYYLTVSFGVKSYEAYLEWCKEARELLSKK